MRRHTMISNVACLVFSMSVVLSAVAAEMKPVQLPQPDLDQTKSLAQALKERKTTRQFATTGLSEQTLSNVLWAGFGINRSESGRRTAPSAKNWQEIDIFVATSAGIYRYDAKGNTLIPVVMGDNHALTYSQSPFKDAPVHLVYIADLEKMSGDEAAKMVLAGMDTGFVAQNVYLYCATAGLNTGFRVTLHKEKLAETLKLRPTQKIMGAQSIGMPMGK